MWPFGRSGIRKTVAEQRRDASKKIASISTEIGRLHEQVIRLERAIPYIRSDSERRNADLRKLRLENRLKSLENQRHNLSKV